MIVPGPHRILDIDRQPQGFDLTQNIRRQSNFRAPADVSVHGYYTCCITTTKYVSFSVTRLAQHHFTFPTSLGFYLQNRRPKSIVIYLRTGVSRIGTR